MKDKKLYALFGIALAISFGACSDDDIVKGSSAEEGQEVNFGAELDNTKSRTYYGEKDTENNAFPIYWNDEAKGFDKIFIYAPNAMTGRNQAYYTVHPTQEAQTAPAAVVKIGETGVQWGTEATKFYSFYPGNENFQLSAEGTAITATLPGDQTITFDYDLDNNQTDHYLFETNPDMSCVMMVAQTPEAINPTTDAVSLQFEPLSTVIDVTVCGPTEGNTTNPYRVTSVSLISETNQICGEFTYDYETKAITATSTNAADKMITVRTMGLDSQGNYVGVPLYTGQTMNVKISMLPNVNVDDLKVQVTTADSKIWTKTLKTANLAPGQINPVTLPQLIASEAKLDYSRWLSQLDPRIYISEISLPGSALAFNIDGYMASGNANQCTQFGTLDQQFNAGIRAFQGHFWLIPGESPVDHKEGQFVLTTSNGNNTGISLMYACQRLQEEMQKSHSHGFCVLLLSDYSITGTSYNIEQVYDRFQDVTAELQRRNILAPDITPKTTLAEVRGKIVLKLQLNGNGLQNTIVGGRPITPLQVSTARSNALGQLQSCWSALAISGTEQTKSLFNWWTESAGSNVFYSPMTFGTIGTFTYSGNAGPITQTTPGIAVEAARVVAGATQMNVMNCISRPADMNTGMWYIYSEQAAAGSNLSQCQTNITNMVSVIPATYTGQFYNKFYMTYVGGAGSSYGETVKNNLNSHWLAQTENASKQGENYPLGWVLFNDATDHFTSGTLTKTCIERVINQNTKEGFILERDRTASITPAAAPSGDTQGTRNGGSVF